MYGTVAKFRVRQGMEAELERMASEGASRIPGFSFEYAFRLDSDPQDLYLVVGFESEEAYRRNAESPEQHTRYESYRALLERDPEWHDGEVIFSVLA